MQNQEQDVKQAFPKARMNTAQKAKQNLQMFNTFPHNVTWQ